MTRIDELSEPVYVTPKFTGYPEPEYKYINLPRPITPMNDPLIEKLSKLPSYKITPKYVKPGFVTGVKKSALSYEATPKIIALGKPFPVYVFFVILFYLFYILV